MNRYEFRQLQLAGTISFPATMPQVGHIRLVIDYLPQSPADCDNCVEFICIDEHPTARVTLTRQVQADRVRALFVPRDPSQVNLEDGTWYLGSEILPFLRTKPLEVIGIAYVAEQEPTLLKVSAGMTAAESSQYYPPLPVDRSNNHYVCKPKPNIHAVACDEVRPEPPEEVATVQSEEPVMVQYATQSIHAVHAMVSELHHQVAQVHPLCAPEPVSCDEN